MKRQGEPKKNSLRKRAEKFVSQHHQQPAIPPGDNPQTLIHELQVYQIELEMQNEELRRQQAETEEVKERYRDLYDFAPLGYFTFDPDGRIAEVNLTGATLLGFPRSRMIGRSFSEFVERDCLALFRKHLQEVFASDVRQSCELRIRQSREKSSIYVSLESIASRKEDEEIKCRSAVIDIHERKQMEERLREYERMIENSRDIIAAVDRDYKYVLANDLFLKYVGKERSQVIGKSVRDIVGEDAFETVVKKNIDACFWGKTVQYEMKRVYPELGERDLLLRNFPIENPGGINRIACIIQDITDRKRAEGVMQARLRILEAANTPSVDEILQKALDEIESQTGSKIGFYHFLKADQETLLLQSWSTNTVQKMCTAEGKGSHYPISKAGVWIDCVHERRPVIHNDFASLPHRKGMPPGHAPVIRELVVPILRGGRIAAIIGVGNKPTNYDETDIEIASLLGDLSWEIVERKRAEQVIERSEKRYRSYIEVTAQLGWITNADGEVVEDIPSWRKFTGQDEEQVKGWGWSNALHPDDFEHTAQVWRNAVARKTDYEMEYRIRRYDGLYRHFLARGVPVSGDDGNVREWVGTCIDITDRKRAEEALRKAHDELEMRVQERTSELSEAVQRLRAENIQRKRLEDTLRASENQVRFFASQCLTAQETERKRIAGELHDSVAGSLGAMKFRIEKVAEEMKQGHVNPESLQDLASIVTEINKEVRRIMADLRPSILDDLGIIPAVSWFCREYQKTYSHISVENQIGVSEHEVPDALKTPIFRILQEAMNNIAKYSKASLVNLSLRKEDTEIHLTIQDNGQGFDLETVKRGMGLSTMRERAQLSGGSFNLETAMGKGTTVRASWPI